MRNIITVLFLLITTIVFSQETLKFNQDGNFKILQLTDIHWSGDPKFTAKTENTIRTLVTRERPDLIVLTGDNVNCDPMRKGWNELGGILEDLNTPWTMVFGNHDGEHDLTNFETFDLVKKFPHFIGDKGSVTGSGNFSLPVLGQSSSNPAAYLFFLDSGDYTRNPKLGTYNWIKRDQVEWYSEESNRQKNLNKKVSPSLMFFHIPLVEYAETMKDPATIGEKREEVSSSEVNSGLFASLLENKNVMGVFCGHDHDNNFIGTNKGIALAYGNKTGNDGYGELEHGGRIILLKEGRFAFETYITTDSGTKFSYSYPAGLPKIDPRTKIFKSTKILPKNPGIHFDYYEGNAENVAGIKNLKIKKTGTAKDINLEMASAEDHFGLIFNGYISIPDTDFYKFYTYSDDGSILKIDGQEIVNNDGGHSAQRKEGTVALEKGYHKIEILYFEDYMGQTLECGFSSEKIAEQSLQSMLWY